MQRLLVSDFNPRVPCGTRLFDREAVGTTIIISTHASLAGRDASFKRAGRGEMISTHASLAGRDGCQAGDGRGDDISTHASLAGRDAMATDL